MYANILIEYPVKTLDKTFTYIIPDDFKNTIKVGMKVTVPFASKKVSGIVLGLINDKPNFEMKEIISLDMPYFHLNDEQLEIGKFIKEKTLCPLISAYQTILPSSLKINDKSHDYSKYQTYLILNKEFNHLDDYIQKNNRFEGQISLINDLKDNDKVLKDNYSISSVKTLIKNGVIKEVKERLYRISNNSSNKSNIAMNMEQLSVFNSVNLNEYNTYLLQGVTGSGKTLVYMELINKVIENGKTAIVLVPEICLTTQTVDRFYNRFGNNVAVFHSALSDGEKFDEYQKIYNGEVSVVVGTRSSIFVPLKNLGLIVIDEEHSETYKQDNTPRYNAIDIAKFRCERNNIPLILASATPSLESRARAYKGVYKLLRLDKRVNNLLMPDIELIDMKKEKINNQIISNQLLNEIKERLINNEQIILLLNRRGFSTFISCKECGYTYKCPNCDITLTYHKSSNKLRCHYCGYFIYKDDKCPSCHSDSLNYLGLGTEKVEETLHNLVPDARIIRMDQDTTSKKGSYQKIIDSFANHEYDILLGTQMISKGLDFKDVTLVGIINADTSLNIPDFRASEKTFDLLYQTSGRSGRFNKQGKVLIQTFNPDNNILKLIKNNNYDKFYEYEMNVRHTLKYPPYTYLLLIKVSSQDYDYLSNKVNDIKKYLDNNLNDSFTILGPTPSPIFKVNNIYSFQLIIKYTKENNLKDTLKNIDEVYSSDNKVNIDFIFDPNHF